MQFLIDLFLHLDKHLADVILQYGIWTYAILFVIIFCETGLVVTPFLPGDSLLFAVGALSSTGAMSVHSAAVLLLIAAVLGDAVNYSIGKFLGPKVFEYKDSRLFKKEYLHRTQRFYEKYGGKTIVIARFVPIVRTFAPFLAGVGEMKYRNFAVFNVLGALLWVLLLVYCGYFFGEMSFVKNNFSVVIVAIIIISVLPAVVEAWRAKREAAAAKGA